jgi:NAD(P)-dependent dehydrogenase (short-subunit alcohol dehydrogenase family)
MVSSLVHHLGYPGGIRWDKLCDASGYVPWKAYSQSKLACMLHARALDVALAARGAAVVAHAVHPGAVPTRGAADGEAHSGTAGSCLSALGGRFHRSVAQGAASIVFAAASPQLDAGRGSFICNANRADGHASRMAKDVVAALRLWEMTRAALRDFLACERDMQATDEVGATAPPAEEGSSGAAGDALPASTGAA